MSALFGESSKVTKEFFTAEISTKPMLLEVFTNDFDESKALEIIINMETKTQAEKESRTKRTKSK